MRAGINWFVITSYSIHYTKLYEEAYFLTQGQVTVEVHANFQKRVKVWLAHNRIFHLAEDYLDRGNDDIRNLLCWCAQRPNWFVITSYSIHYTKLYDTIMMLSVCYK